MQKGDFLDKKGVLLRLFSLSKRHLRLVHEEDWEQWEMVITAKKGLYRDLEELIDRPLDEEENQILHAIKKIEEKTKHELERKRNVAGQKIARINRTKTAMRGYRQANRKSFSRHFGIRC